MLKQAKISKSGFIQSIDDVIRNNDVIPKLLVGFVRIGLRVWP